METAEKSTNMEGGGIIEDLGTGLNTWWRNVGRDNLGYPKPWNVIGRYRTKTYYPPTRYVAPLPQASDVNAQAAVNQLNQSIMDLQTTYAGVYNAAAAIGKSNGEMSQTVANISALVNDVHSHVQALYGKIGSLTQLRNNVNTLIQQNDQLMANLNNDRTILERLKADRAVLEQTSAGLLNNIVNATNFINNMKASLVSLNLNNNNTPQMAAALRQIMNQLRIINGTIMTVDGSGAAPVPGMGMGMGAAAPYGMGMGMAQPGAFPYGPGAPMGVDRPEWMGQVQPGAMPYGLGAGQMNGMPYEMRQWMGPDLIAQQGQNKFYNLEQLGAPGVPPVAPGMPAVPPGGMWPMGWPMAGPGVVPGAAAAAPAGAKQPESSVNQADGSTSPPGALSSYDYYKDYDANNDIDAAALRGKRANDGVYRELRAKDRLDPYAARDEMGQKEDLAQYGDFGKYRTYGVKGQHVIVGDANARMALYGIDDDDPKPVPLDIYGVPLVGDKTRRFQKQVYLPAGRDARWLYKEQRNMPGIADIKNRKKASSLDVLGHDKVDDANTAAAALANFKGRRGRQDQDQDQDDMGSLYRTPTPGRPGDELKPGYRRLKLDNPKVRTPEFADVDDNPFIKRGRELVKKIINMQHEIVHASNNVQFFMRFLKRTDLPPLTVATLKGKLKDNENLSRKLAYEVSQLKHELYSLVHKEDKKEHALLKDPELKQQLINLEIIQGRKTRNLDSPALESSFVPSTSNKTETDSDLKYRIIGYESDTTPPEKKKIRDKRIVQRARQAREEKAVLQAIAAQRRALQEDENDARWFKQQQAKKEQQYKLLTKKQQELKKREEYVDYLEERQNRIKKKLPVSPLKPAPVPELESESAKKSTSEDALQEVNRFAKSVAALPGAAISYVMPNMIKNTIVKPFLPPTETPPQRQLPLNENQQAWAKREQELAEDIMVRRGDQPYVKTFAQPEKFIQRDFNLKQEQLKALDEQKKVQEELAKQGNPLPTLPPIVPINYSASGQKSPENAPEVKNAQTKPYVDNIAMAPYTDVVENYGYAAKNTDRAAPAAPAPVQAPSQNKPSQYQNKPAQYQNKPPQYQGKNKYQNIKNAWKNKKGGYIYNKSGSDGLHRDSFWTRRPAVTRNKRRSTVHSIRRHK